MKKSQKPLKSLSLIPASLLGLTLVQSQKTKLFGFFWPFKMVAGGWAPILGLLSLAGGLLNWKKNNHLAALAGFAGALISLDHIRRLARPYKEVHQAFPKKAQKAISTIQKNRMLKQPYSPIPPRPPRNTPFEDLPYGHNETTGKPLLANLWFPPDSTPPSGIVLIHIFGGAWHYLHKDFGTRVLFRHLTGQGHAVLDINYTLAPKTDLVGMVKDIKQAIQWVRREIPQIQGETTRIVLMGVSSGAHLALLSAYTPNQSKFQPRGDESTEVDGVISSYGIVDLVEAYSTFRYQFGNLLTDHTGLERCLKTSVEWLLRRITFLEAGKPYVDPGDWLESLLGGSPYEMPERYKIASPSTHIGPHCPPTLFLQGNHDFTRILPSIQQVYERLKGAGVPCALVILDHTEHAFDAPIVNFPVLAPATQAALYTMERFLAALAPITRDD
jgi:acetyl esterase/lipase